MNSKSCAVGPAGTDPSSLPAPVPSLIASLSQEQLLILAAVLIACLATAALAFLMFSGRRQRQLLTLSLRAERMQENIRAQEADIQRLRRERNELARECRELDAENAALRSSCTAMQRQVAERDSLLIETRRQIEQDFHLVAGRIISEKGERLHREHSSALTMLLKPFHEQILEFRSRLEALHERDSRDRVSMLKEIEQLKDLNRQLSSDATNLAEALKSRSKLQGQWGEMILTRLLEASGLRSGREFTVQVSLKDEQGHLLQPDVVVHLPDDRTVVIDSKVSLRAFVEAHASRDEGRRQEQVRQHLDSLKRHIQQLSQKQYQHLTGAGSLDFVLLFIPIEGAFQLAVEEEPEILVSAMNRKVILTSPSTLLAILRTIHHLWRLDEQSRHSFLIAKQAGNLYDKFVSFTESLEEIGLRLNQSQQAWQTARNRLSTGTGNLIARAEALKHLGVQPNRNLPDSLAHAASQQGDTP